MPGPTARWQNVRMILAVLGFVLVGALPFVWTGWEANPRRAASENDPKRLFESITEGMSRGEVSQLLNASEEFAGTRREAPTNPGAEYQFTDLRDWTPRTVLAERSVWHWHDGWVPPREYWEVWKAERAAIVLEYDKDGKTWRIEYWVRKPGPTGTGASQK